MHDEQYGKDPNDSSVHFWLVHPLIPDQVTKSSQWKLEVFRPSGLCLGLLSGVTQPDAFT